MSCNIFVVFSLIFAVSVMSLSEASSENDMVRGSPDNGTAILPGAAPLDNISIHKDIIIQSLAQYEEDLNFSSHILDEFIKKNITNSDAMVATSSLLGLSSQSRDTIYSMRPTGEYKGNHNDTILALTYLNAFLWDMAKFYETNKISYALAARVNYNESLYYYGRAKQGIE